jgi:hypothetical protein
MPIFTRSKPGLSCLLNAAADPCTEDGNGLSNGGTRYLGLRVKPLMRAHGSPLALAVTYASYVAHTVCAVMNNG